jgi:hypothetical protein
MAGSGLGGVCLPVMFRSMLNQVGFGWTVRAIAFLFLACLIVANLLVRSRLPPPGWTKGTTFLDLSPFKEPIFCLVAVHFSWGY